MITLGKFYYDKTGAKLFRFDDRGECRGGVYHHVSAVKRTKQKHCFCRKAAPRLRDRFIRIGDRVCCKCGVLRPGPDKSERHVRGAHPPIVMVGRKVVRR